MKSFLPLTRSLMLFLALLLALPAVHAGPEVQDAVTRLTALLGRAETLGGRFSQLSLDATGTRLQESTGEMLLKRPGQFRWHTDPPMEQLLVSNGEKVWLYDPDLEQVTIRKLDPRQTHTPALLLSGDVANISRNFTVTCQENGDVTEFRLKPKVKDTLFDRLQLTFRNGLINDMQLIDSVGQRTRILFSDVQMNRKLAADSFTFQVPAGVDVIAE